jgi:hypothetical protein
MICAWHKIWTLSGRLSLMRNVQLMTNIYIYIPCIPHNNNCKHKNWFTRHETDRFPNYHCQECVRAYLSIHDCLSFLHEVMIGNHRTKAFLHKIMTGNHRNKTTCTRSCRFLVVVNIFRLETWMNSLVKVPPYSKLNFQREIVFTQNWCTITLSVVFLYHF